MAPRTSTETIIEEKSLFALLNEANQENVKPKGILGTTSDVVCDSLSVLTGTIRTMSQGMELANSYIAEELDRQIASRTTTKVECTIEQLTAIARLTAFGCNSSEAISLATSYRR